MTSAAGRETASTVSGRGPEDLGKGPGAQGRGGAVLDGIAGYLLPGGAAVAAVTLPWSGAALCCAVALALLGVLPGWTLACFVTVVVALCVLASWLPGGRQRTRPLPERAWKEYCAELAELTALQLAGGIGIEEALRGSLILAGSPAAGRVREAFEAAGPVPRPAAEVLERVALTEGVGPLASLASCLQMSVSSGAPVATTLLARADSLRTEVLAEQQARAARMAERLFLPGILLMLGFMTLVGYPAVALISKGFS